MAAPAAGAIAKQALKHAIASQAARAARGHNDSGGSLRKNVALALLVFMLAIVVGIGSCGQAIQDCPPGTSSNGDTVPGTWDGPGSLGGVAGTGVTPDELRTARAHSLGGTKITPGTYRSTAYAPAAGGTNCNSNGDCSSTASGIRVDSGKRRRYIVASNPKLLQYGAMAYIWPNPYAWAGPFVVADTGGAFRGHGRLDFYAFEPGGYSKAMQWGNTRDVKVSSKPIVDGGPDVTDGGDAAPAAATTRLASNDRAASPRTSGSSSAKMMRPTATGPFTSPFGRRWGRLHAGVDIGVPVGTPIVAVLDGTVLFRGVLGGYGNYTCLRHPGNIVTCYGHQSSFGSVSVGEQVRQGQVIGYSGNTGSSTGPHLHFEVRLGTTISAQPVDPAPYLSGAKVPDANAGAETVPASDTLGRCVCKADGGGTLPGEIPDPFKRIFTEAANAAHIDPRLVAAIFYYGENGKHWPNPYGPWPSSSAGAQGPFQFLPSTWSGYARDGDGDGKTDIQNFADAAFGAAAYLAASGAKDGTEAGIRRAIFAYNHAQWYVDLVYNGMQDFGGQAADQAATADAANSSCGGDEGDVEVGAGGANGYAMSAMVSYDQGDPEWAGKPYGSSTIATSGCGPTSVAMVLSTLKKRKYTPAGVASRYKRFHVPGAGSSWDLFPTAANENGLKATNFGADITRLRQTIRAGGLGIISVSAGYFTGGGHIMVVRGMSEDGSRFFLNDPNGKGRHGDSETRAFSAEFLRSAGNLRNVWGITQ